MRVVTGRIRRMLDSVWDSPARSARSLLRGGLLEAFFALVVFLISRLTGGHNSLVPIALDLIVAVGAALSSRHPMLGGVTAGAGATLWLLFPTVAPTFGMLGALVAVVAVLSNGRIRLAAGLTLWYTAAMTAVISLWTSANLQRTLVNLISLAAMLALAWATGLTILSLRRRAARADALAVGRLREQRLALAQDLHDTVAQAIAGMILEGEKAKSRLAKGDDPQTIEDLDLLLRLGRQSLRDLRGMMAVLRQEITDLGDSSVWQVSDARAVLDEQLERLKAGGFVTSALIDGDVESLPPSIQEWLGKLTIEAVTNILRHGQPGGHCSVMVEVRHDMVEAMFANPMRDDPHRQGGHSERLGLTGARERAEALGGELEVLEATDRWVLGARVPLHD